MGRENAGVVHDPQNSSCAKVHNSICYELKIILDKLSSILPAIESARPGYTAGIQELCCLNNTIEKAKLLIQHCTESSMLYLAITGESIVLRCERIRSSLNHSLLLIENMVPQMLAVQISNILYCLRHAKFIIDSTEDEAGKAMLELLGQTDASEDLEFKAFQTAVSSLKIMSPKALLIERRSIKRLLEKIHGSDPKKERILNYFLYLIKKYEKKLKANTLEHKEHDRLQENNLDSISADANTFEKNGDPTNLGEVRTDSMVNYMPPEEFCCPISSRLMLDPVVIASGQTFERVSIEKWFMEGHDTCPRTQMKLRNLSMIPNTCMKDLISNWCIKHDVNLQEPSVPMHSWDSSQCNSVTSLKNVNAALLDERIGEYTLQSDHSNVSVMSSDASYCSDSSSVKGMDSLKDNHALVFSWSDDYLRCQSFYSFSHDMYLRFFSELCDLSLDNRDKAMENFKSLLDGNEDMCYSMLSNGFVEAVMTFLKNACNLSDMHAQRTGAQIFLAFLSNKRVEIPTISEETFQLLFSFLESEINLEALMILQMLSHHQNFKSIVSVSGLILSIIRILDCKDLELLKLCTKILFDLSSDRELRPHIITCGCIQKLVPLLRDAGLSGICLKILVNLSEIKEAVMLIAETNGCIASIVELLEIGSWEDQENGVAILHSLCSQSLDSCLLVMKEGVIPSLVDISINGNAKGKENSMRLLHLLKDLRLSGTFETSDPQSGSASEPAGEDITDQLTDRCIIKQPNSKPYGFFGRKMRFFLKPRSLALS